MSPQERCCTPWPSIGQGTSSVASWDAAAIPREVLLTVGAADSQSPLASEWQLLPHSFLERHRAWSTEHLSQNGYLENGCNLRAYQHSIWECLGYLRATVFFLGQCTSGAFYLRSFACLPINKKQECFSQTPPYGGDCEQRGPYPIRQMGRRRLVAAMYTIGERVRPCCILPKSVYMKYEANTKDGCVTEIRPQVKRTVAGPASR